MEREICRSQKKSYSTIYEVSNYSKDEVKGRTDPDLLELLILITRHAEELRLEFEYPHPDSAIAQGWGYQSWWRWVTSSI